MFRLYSPFKRERSYQQLADMKKQGRRWWRFYKALFTLVVVVVALVCMSVAGHQLAHPPACH